MWRKKIQSHQLKNIKRKINTTVRCRSSAIQLAKMKKNHNLKKKKKKYHLGSKFCQFYLWSNHDSIDFSFPCNHHGSANTTFHLSYCQSLLNVPSVFTIPSKPQLQSPQCSKDNFLNCVIHICGILQCFPLLE